MGAAQSVGSSNTSDALRAELRPFARYKNTNNPSVIIDTQTVYLRCIACNTERFPSLEAIIVGPRPSGKAFCDPCDSKMVEIYFRYLKPMDPKDLDEVFNREVWGPDWK